MIIGEVLIDSTELTSKLGIQKVSEEEKLVETFHKILQGEIEAKGLMCESLIEECEVIEEVPKVEDEEKTQEAKVCALLNAFQGISPSQYIYIEPLSSKVESIQDDVAISHVETEPHAPKNEDSFIVEEYETIEEDTPVLLVPEILEDSHPKKVTDTLKYEAPLHDKPLQRVLETNTFVDKKISPIDIPKKDHLQVDEKIEIPDLIIEDEGVQAKRIFHEAPRTDPLEEERIHISEDLYIREAYQGIEKLEIPQEDMPDVTFEPIIRYEEPSKDMGMGFEIKDGKLVDKVLPKVEAPKLVTYIHETDTGDAILGHNPIPDLNYNRPNLDEPIKVPANRLFQEMVQEFATHKEGEVKVLKIKLQTEYLGEVEMKLVARGKEISATIVTGTPEAMDLIKNQLFLVRQNLLQQNLVLNNISVSLRGEGGFDVDHKGTGNNRGGGSSNPRNKEDRFISAGKKAGRVTGEGTLNLFI